MLGVSQASFSAYLRGTLPLSQLTSVVRWGSTCSTLTTGPFTLGKRGAGNSKLFARLKHHLSDDLAERWDRFSWFGLRRVLNSGELSKATQSSHPAMEMVLDHIEAILIHSIEPPLNRQGGRFGESVTRYLQRRDDRLGPTEEGMIRDLWKESQNQ